MFHKLNFKNNTDKITQRISNIRINPREKSNLFLNMSQQILEKEITKEIYIKPSLFPALGARDIAIVGIVGLVATLLDIFLVRIPKDINYLSKYTQEGGSLTGFLRRCGANKDGKLNDFLAWCEAEAKVPYDKVKDISVEGLYPKNHRLLTLGHDPIIGLIFGTLDIWNGTLSSIDINGHFQIIKVNSLDSSEKLLSAPIIWLGHLISDVCTSMGLPIPGWSLLQFLQDGNFGEKQRTVADISRWMYLNGYDIRHFLSMAIVPGSIELLVRGYYYLNKYFEKKDLNDEQIYTKAYMKKDFGDLKLHKMLFLTHAAATSGNALKVAMYHGNPLAVNVDQWIVCLKESVYMFKAMHRNRTIDMIERNRIMINERWSTATQLNETK